MASDYQEYDNLPEYVVAQFGDGVHAPIKWSNRLIAPPKIGERVMVTLNGLGPARVVGYFTDCGWLGLRVKFDDPPAWYTRQNGTLEPGHVFGAEVEQYTDGENNGR